MPSTHARRSDNKCALHPLAVLLRKAYIQLMQRIADIFAARPSDGEFGPDVEDDPNRNTNDSPFSRWKHLRRSNFASSDEIAAHLRAFRGE